MTTLIAVGLGALIGLALGALGGGGAVLAVPALVYLLGQTPQEATSASLVIVGATSAISALNHTRSGHVRWRIGFTFAAAGIPASFAGTALNAAVDGPMILVAFSVVMAISAVSMLWRTRSAPRALPADGAAAEHPAASRRTRTIRALKIVGAGLTVGFLTGFLGVGGGFVIVPALVAVLGFTMPAAVGTSLVIISLSSGGSLLARVGSNHFDWTVIAPFMLAAVLGSFAGKAVADRLPARVLMRVFAVLLLAVATYVVIEAI